jgi:hypothetical protein
MWLTTRKQKTPQKTLDNHDSPCHDLQSLPQSIATTMTSRDTIPDSMGPWKKGRGSAVVTEIATLRDVAKVAGVATSTVSRALNGHPDIDAKTQKRIVRLARELNYRPHSRARQLVNQSTETVGFILSNRSTASC